MLFKSCVLWTKSWSNSPPSYIQLSRLLPSHPLLRHSHRVHHCLPHDSSSPNTFATHGSLGPWWKLGSGGKPSRLPLRIIANVIGDTWRKTPTSPVLRPS